MSSFAKISSHRTLAGDTNDHTIEIPQDTHTTSETTERSPRRTNGFITNRSLIDLGLIARQAEREREFKEEPPRGRTLSRREHSPRAPVQRPPPRNPWASRSFNNQGPHNPRTSYPIPIPLAGVPVPTERVVQTLRAMEENLPKKKVQVETYPVSEDIDGEGEIDALDFEGVFPQGTGDYGTMTPNENRKTEKREAKEQVCCAMAFFGVMILVVLLVFVWVMGKCFDGEMRVTENGGI